MQPVVVQQPTTTVSVVPNSQVVLGQQPRQSDICENYASKQAFLLGVAQVVIGALCIILQIAATAIDAKGSEAVTGIWCGVVYLICGILGILSGRSKHRCMITGCMVACIVATVLFLLPLLVAASVGIAHDNDKYYCDRYIWSYQDIECPPLEDKEAKVGLNVCLLILVFIEFGALIWASALCCSVLCCGVAGNSGQVIVSTMPVQTVSTGPMVVVPATGPMFSPAMQPQQQLPPYTVQQHQQQQNPMEMRQTPNRPTAPVSSYHEYAEIPEPPPSYKK